MQDVIYLDNSATTKPCDEAVKAALNAMENCYGNPSSLYEFGMQAEDIVTDARKTIAKALFCREDEVYFTSCGSESNNTAIFGAVELLKRSGKHIVTTAIEHPSVLEPVLALENAGYEVTRIAPDKFGNISLVDIENAVREDTVLVTMMYVNNEVGSILPVEKIKSIVQKKGSRALVHIDCVQAFGKLKINAPALGADLISLSAHKIHGIKGAGVLFVKKGVRLSPLIKGGGQEKGLRSGTEAVPAIAAFGAAVKALPDLNNSAEYLLKIKNYCLERLKAFENVVINSPENSSPYILNFSFLGYRSETVLHHLERYFICVSSGSACSKGKGSYVLREMGLNQSVVDSALRLSFSRQTTTADIDKFIDALQLALKLRKSNI
ncbi:MAG: cysteine desulfurase [Clostridia bacterium]|nr:cysteine desulfurase [Clostridia bacterium]